MIPVDGSPKSAASTNSSAPVLVGAGDIASRDDADTETARLIEEMPDATVFTAGDNAYFEGSWDDFEDYYEPTWGAFKNRTRPTPGNHDYETRRARPYFEYFGESAGPAGKGYYSYDLGEWHIVALNSEIDTSPRSEQVEWLRSDLAASNKKCTLAYWHRSLFSSRESDPLVRPLYQVLYDANAEVVVTGHNHQYERFAPQDPDGERDTDRGIVQFVVGTGGAELYDFRYTIQPNSEVRNDSTFGVVKFTLHPDKAEFAFVPVAGQSFEDSGTITCR
jgi:hypothetical protein